MTGGLEAWKRVVGADGRDLIEEATSVDPKDVTAVARLRRLAPRDDVEIALELVAARRMARAKFPDRADRLLADRAGVEQASATRVAEHKATRYRALALAQVHDLCCGIGGDAMALASVAEVTGIDVDPVRAWMCGENARCSTACIDVVAAPPPAGADTAFHLDPARRIEGEERRRLHRYEDYRPGPAFIASVRERYRAGSIKLGPGVDLDDVPETDQGELEWIEDAGELVQCVWWTGELARDRGRRRATMLPSGESIVGEPRAVAVIGDGRFDAWLYVPRPAIERARLVHTVADPLALREVIGGLGLLTGPEHHESAWWTSYRVLEVLPWREGRIAQWLRAHDAGEVVVKSRGRAIDANRAARALRGSGATPYTVFGLRSGAKRILAVITAGA
ncbi:MAG: hypothetical protein KDC38_01545 [Planctomycetes bacterium]|nr:hypothetical protein [Planctomycetota bacterium]